MNYKESQIENFTRCNAGVPQSLAVSALVERFFEGWYKTDIAVLPENYDPTETPEWEDLEDSPAWGYAGVEAIVEGIRTHIMRESVEKVFQLFDEALDNKKEDALTRIAAKLGDRLSFTASTDEDWEEDDGDPVCKTTTEVCIFLDGEEIGVGEAIGFYTHCKSGGEQWSSWQDGDGPCRDRGWQIIVEMLVAAGVIRDTYELDECIEAPSEPSEPEENDEGEYVMLYHGWEQAWTVKGRYETKDEASRAMRLADRATTEANSSGAYGWEYAVGVISEEGEEISGLKITFNDVD